MNHPWELGASAREPALEPPPLSSPDSSCQWLPDGGQALASLLGFVLQFQLKKLSLGGTENPADPIVRDQGLGSLA